LTKFYQKMIKDYSKTILSLYTLFKKNEKFAWNETTKKVFQFLKNVFSTSFIIKYYDFTLTTMIETNASNEILRKCLTQIYANEKKYSIVYYSRKLQSVEINYDVKNKKMLVIINCLKKWRLYLQETIKKFKILTNHGSLEYFITIKKLTRKQTKWSKILAKYNLKIIYNSEKKNVKTNALNKRSNYETSKKHRNHC
jgi:hypothetical protein